MALHSFTLRRDTGPSPDVVESFLNTFEVYLNANNINNTAQLAFNAGTLADVANGVLGGTVGVEASDPRLLSVTGSPYLALLGATTNTVTIPDAAGIDLTTNLTMRVAFAPMDATPASAYPIMMKGTNWTAAGVNYGIGIDTSGNAVLKVTDSTSTLRTWTSSAAAWTADGAVRLVEASLNAATGVATFRTKTLVDITEVQDECADDTGWVALGTTVAGTVTGGTLLANASALQVQSAGDTLPAFLYYAEVRNTAGTVVASFDPRLAANASAVSWTSAQSQTVTIARATSGAKISLVLDSAQWQFDGGDFIDVPDVSDIDLAAGGELTLFAVVREFATQGTANRIIGKANNTADNDGYLLDKTAAGTITGSIRDGATTNAATQTGFTASDLHVIMLVVTPTGVTTWVDGTKGTTTTRTATDCTNALALRIGADTASGTFFTGEMIAAGVTMRSLVLEEILAISAYFRGTTYVGGYGDWLRSLDSTSPLRTDNFSSIPATSGDAFFDVAPISYTEVQVEWNVVVDDLTNVQVVCSTEGFPVTILDGRLVLSVSSLQANGSMVDTGATSGRWHYYSLFAKIDDGSTPHFERVATADCLVPFNYGSAKMLYYRIPPWYQEQDTSGDLYRFLDLVGYELDFARSMGDVLRDLRDPAVIPSAALYMAGRMLGIPQVVEGISETRYRALLRNFAYLNSIKGTLAGIEQYLSVITGTKVVASVLGPNNIAVALYAQRVNLVREPIMNGALWTETAGGTTTIGYSGGSVNIGGGASGGTASIAMTGITTLGLTEYSLGLQVTTATAGITLSASLTVTAGTATGTVVPLPLYAAVTGGQQRVYTIPAALPAGATACTLTITAVMPASASLSFKEPILEPGAVGAYFDGNSISGGFLPGSTGVQDYRWLGSANASVSGYTMNFGVVAGVVEQILPYIVPAGVKVGSDVSDQYSVTNFNVYPGS